MNLWLLLTGVFVLQESISTTYVVLEAVRAHYSLVLINLLWLAVTVAQVYVGYEFGAWIQRRFATSKFERGITVGVRRMNEFVGKSGEKVALVFFTILTAPFFTGFIGSWLPISFWNILFFSVLGDLVWYATVWLGVYGANQFASSLQTTVISVVLISIVLTIPVSIWRRRMMQKSQKTKSPSASEV